MAAHRLRKFIFLFLFPILGFAQQLETWREGYLDIHHINTGSGNCTFFIFPDGTTMVFDVGDVDRTNRSSNPLKIATRLPNDSLSAAKSIAGYIQKVIPAIKHIDYAVLSHFHPDHYGSINPLSTYSRQGTYKLSGITELHEYLPIRKLIDRNYPDYTYPVDIKRFTFDSTTFINYLSFLRTNISKHAFTVESLNPGSQSQLVLLKNPKNFNSFHVRNIKSNGFIWTGQGETYFNTMPATISSKDYNENPLGLALKISYGKFDYFIGGDMTGLKGFGLPSWFDMETPVAKVVGQVDALSLNHHGVRDASNEFFLKTLAPRVIVQQAWSSNHPGEEVLHRIISPVTYDGARDIFATYIHPETIATFGRWLPDNYKSMRGHVLLRVLPDSNEYFIYILDDTNIDLPIVKTFGPYQSK
jgi:beta-lactamase superfamily II metal-dependent hydrolase